MRSLKESVYVCLYLTFQETTWKGMVHSNHLCQSTSFSPRQGSLCEYHIQIHITLGAHQNMQDAVKTQADAKVKSPPSTQETDTFDASQQVKMLTKNVESEIFKNQKVKKKTKKS